MGINSAGLLFDSYVTQDEANAMTPIERAIGLPQRLVIDAPPSDIDDFAFKYSKENDLNDTTNDGSENAAINITSVQPYNGIVDDVYKKDGFYNVKARLDGDVEISTKTVTATCINEGIQLDNPKRANIVTGTVNVPQNGLLYLPIPSLRFLLRRLYFITAFFAFCLLAKHRRKQRGETP